MSYDTGNPVPSKDPRDLVDNAENMDEAVNGTGSSWTDRLGNSRPTLKHLEDEYPNAGAEADRAEAAAEDAETAQAAAEAAQAAAETSGANAAVSQSAAAASASSAAASASDAQTYAEAAASAGDTIYDDTTDGLNGTTEGDYFYVPSAVEGELLILYLHDTGGVATEIGRSSDAAAVTSVSESVPSASFAIVSNSVNLFSSSAITSGQTLRNGGLQAQAGTFVTGYIPVVAGEDFIASAAIKGDGTYGGVSFYNYNYDVVSYSHAAVTAETAVSVPAGAVWMRCAFNIATTSQSSLGVYFGDAVPSEYRSYGVIDSQTQRDTINAQSTELHSVINGFDQNEITDEFYLTSSNNTEVANSTYYITSYIPVVQGGTVTFSASTSLGSGFGLTWYDAEQNHIAGAAGQGTPPVADTPYTVPTRASYVRATFHRVNQPASDLVVVQSASVPDDYLPHGIGQALDYLSPWAGAGVMHLGDSITDNFRGDTQWVEYLRGKMRSVLVANEAKAGRRMRDCAKTTAGDDLVVGDLTDVDLIICMCGTNDFNAARVGGTGALLGTIDDAASYAANSFYANTKYVIETLLGLKSTVRIVFFTPTYRSAAPSADTESAEGYTLYDYADAVKQVCALYGVPVLDLLRDGGLNSFNTGDYLADGLHPTSTDGGVTIIGKPAAAWLSSIR